MYEKINKIRIMSDNKIKSCKFCELKGTSNPNEFYKGRNNECKQCIKIVNKIKYFKRINKPLTDEIIQYANDNNIPYQDNQKQDSTDSDSENDKMSTKYQNNDDLFTLIKNISDENQELKKQMKNIIQINQSLNEHVKNISNKLNIVDNNIENVMDIVQNISDRFKDNLNTDIYTEKNLNDNLLEAYSNLEHFKIVKKIKNDNGDFLDGEDYEVFTDYKEEVDKIKTQIKQFGFQNNLDLNKIKRDVLEAYENSNNK
jgi:hypothetical protein